MLTEEGVGPLTTKARSPHPPASAGTFSLWEKEGARFCDFGSHATLPAKGPP